MRTIYVIGMGPGDPEYLTMQAVDALKEVDVFFILEKQGSGKEALGEARRRILDTHRGAGSYRVVTAPSPPRARAGDDYLDVVADWHASKAELLAGLIAESLSDGQAGGILVWGDPALYDSTIAILRKLSDESGLEITLKVIPGVTSLQLLAARHAIPLHEIGGAFLVTTARRLPEAVAGGHDSIAVLLDSNAAFSRIAPENFDIYWGAYLGTEHEVLMAGPLEALAPALAETVQREKQSHGWILDIYLLKRRKRGVLDGPQDRGL